MEWKVEKVINFVGEKRWGEVFSHLGFHDRRGCQLICEYTQHWVGLYGDRNNILWTAGAVNPGVAAEHIDV